MLTEFVQRIIGQKLDAIDQGYYRTNLAWEDFAGALVSFGHDEALVCE